MVGPLLIVIGLIDPASKVSDRPQVHVSQVEREDVGRTRLLIGPTARALERSEVYIDDLAVFFPSVQVGVTNRVSIGAGTPLLVPQAEVRPGESSCSRRTT